MNKAMISATGLSTDINKKLKLNVASTRLPPKKRGGGDY